MSTTTKPETDQPKTTTTRYVVQQKKEFHLDHEGPPVEAWVDLLEVDAINARKAVEGVMAHFKLDEGDFRAIPEGSAKVHSPRVQRKTVWQ